MSHWIIGFSILNAIIFGYIIIVYYYKRFKTILLLGLSGSGKTRFWRLKTGKDYVVSCISLKTNIDSVGHSVWIDVPGHEKLWKSELSKLKYSGQVVIYFLIDARVFAINRKIVALRLFQTLNFLGKLKTPIIIKVLNQTDQMALEAEKIKILLDKEIDILLKSRLEAIDLDYENVENYQDLDFYFE